ncbi:hypothetical protein [Neisseria sicca]|uniref:hypothetical protein n=1 Tax=Neisseria sicca TaxID=490 RepID=UPI00288098FC|nr:hypothetical protein [Neisseria sicca]
MKKLIASKAAAAIAQGRLKTTKPKRAGVFRRPHIHVRRKSGQTVQIRQKSMQALDKVGN